jgi:hypothetical protein
VSAWAKRNEVSLGQMKTDEKSNEITAIPVLLGLLELRGCFVTIDAMGCRQEIAEKIRAQGADYVLAVKKNQKEIHQAEVRGYPPHRLEPPQTRTFQRKSQAETLQGRVKQ